MISRRGTCWAVLVLGVNLLVLSSSAVGLGAEPAARQLRQWTDATGKHSIQAEFVELKDGKVRLRKEDGKETTVPIEEAVGGGSESMRSSSRSEKRRPKARPRNSPSSWARA